MILSPAFFGYEHDIVAAFQRASWRVDFFDERPSNSSVVRAALRVRSSLLRPAIDAYYRRILGRVEGVPYDLVLIVKGEVVPAWFLEELRRLNPAATVVYYSYDKIADTDNCVDLLSHVDAAYSFDQADVRSRGLSYKPLFYVPAFRPRTDGEPRRWDASFVGTLHSDRHAFVTALMRDLPLTRCHFYVPARWFFARGKYLTKDFAGVGWNEVSFEKLSKDRVAEVFRSSGAVLDVQRFGQSGLTMRTFEVLASGAILVTGNPAVRQEPFFSEDRVLVVDGPDDASAGRRLASMLDTAPPSPPPGFERYAIDRWIDDFTSVVHARRGS